MIVRVYDKDANNYFVSEVYAIINSGYYTKYLVLDDSENTRYFRMVDYLDKSYSGPNLPVNINIISSNELTEQWIHKEEPELQYFMVKRGSKDQSLYEYIGYEFIFEQKNLLLSLWMGNKIKYEEMMGNKKEISSKLSGWNYVDSEEDIQNIFAKFERFEDSVLRTLNYESGSRKDEKGYMTYENIRQVTMIFDSDWTDSIEIVFEGVLSLNLRPAKDNYSPELFSASILLKDKTIFFYEDEVSSVQEDFEGTWINALGMRWRFLQVVK